MRIERQIKEFRVGEVVYEPHGTHGPRRQTHLQLFYLYAGRAWVRQGDRRVDIRAGQAFLFSVEAPMWIRFAGKERSRHGWVDFFQPYQGYLEDLYRQARGPLPVVSPGSAWWQLAEHLYARYIRQGVTPSVAAQVDALLVGYLEAGGLLEDSRLREPLPPALEHLVSRVPARLDEPWNLTALAKTAGVSPGHLTRLCREHFNQTPVAWLWDQRVAAGCRLLEETGLGIQEIADRTGFSSPYHFSRRVKEARGQPPRALRRTAWAG
ncbi:MAG: helix-turn-helix domain-containing protein [Opitutales bacterium]